MAHLHRFIPACAGNSNNRQSLMEIPAGSSPRVRGTLLPAVLRQPERRFIPACAGNASYPIGGRLAQPVHPRVCGERPAAEPHSARYVRFIPACAGNAAGAVAGDRSVSRFIPACAGNARRRCGRSGTGTVHPRVCGERRSLPGIEPSKLAVHPRVCGERAGSAAMAPRTAGSSPRVRGTRRPGRRRSQADCGSSPRVRGTPSDCRRECSRRRFIPACAGNASRTMPFVATTTVHPRVCGEPVTQQWPRLQLPGSSPRVRGTPSIVEAGYASDRFIPACAGNRLRLIQQGGLDRFIPACAGNSLLSILKRTNNLQLP